MSGEFKGFWITKNGKPFYVPLSDEQVAKMSDDEIKAAINKAWAEEQKKQ